MFKQGKYLFYSGEIDEDEWELVGHDFLLKDYFWI